MDYSKRYSFVDSMSVEGKRSSVLRLRGSYTPYIQRRVTERRNIALEIKVKKDGGKLLTKKRIASLTAMVQDK